MTQPSPIIRTLIVDDEAPARHWLRRLCQGAADVSVVGECASVAEASRVLRTSAIDLLLLDIQLGPHDGFQVLDGVACAAIPALVFVTAHDQYAVRAFERRALDYLVKPVQEGRFRDSLERVRRQIRGGLATEVRAAVRESIGALERTILGLRTRGYTRRLIAERAEAYRVIDCERIVALESEANYVRVSEVDDVVPSLMRGTLQSIAAILDPEEFVQISRSVIINLAYVTRITRNADSRLVFAMTPASVTFNVGRTYAPNVVKALALRPDRKDA